MRCVLGGALIALSCTTALSARRAAAANGVELVIEIDPAAERMLDARAARRLVALELSDVSVPERSAGEPPQLFYRVRGGEGGLVRVELWERGELHGTRVVSSAHGGAHLTARRVALAAAEIARSLRQQRLARRRAERREEARRREREREEAERTLEGPLALRPALGGFLGDGFALAGSGVTGELGLRGATRLDLGASIYGGAFDVEDARLSWLEISLGPAQRFELGQALALDLGAFATAALVHVAGASGVDAIDGASTSWSARGGVALRIEPRFTRWIRGSLGLSGGALLRPIPVDFAASGAERLRGGFVGLELGLVLTPPPSPAPSPSAAVPAPLERASR